MIPNTRTMCLIASLKRTSWCHSGWKGPTGFHRVPVWDDRPEAQGQVVKAFSASPRQLQAEREKLLLEVSRVARDNRRLLQEAGGFYHNLKVSKPFNR